MEPNINSEILFEIPEGGVIFVTGKINENYYLVEYFNRAGYLSESWIKKD